MAPNSMARIASSGSSVLANNLIGTPSSVTVRENFKACNAWLFSIAFACRARYSIKRLSSGATTTCPRSPSIMSQSPWRIISLACRTPKTAGISRLRATIEVCEVLPPRSVTNPRKRVFLKRNISCGAISCATIMASLKTFSGANTSWISCCCSLKAFKTRSTT